MKYFDKRIFPYQKAKKTSFKYIKRHKKEFKARTTRTYIIRKLIIIFILAIILRLSSFFIFRYKINKENKPNINIVPKKIKNVYNYSLKYDEYDESIEANYKYLLNYFCENQNENINQEFDNKIRNVNIDLHEKKFDMWVYKSDDVVSEQIIYVHHWESSLTISCLKALEFYSKKKNIENKDVYFIDVGANIGWYSFFLGKFGYKVLSFEANQVNNYILYKNYCINKDVNLSVINKGLDEEDKTCRLITAHNNRGNGAIFCENQEKNSSEYRGDVFNDIEMTKLSRYMKFLSEKNVALMKIDVEGYEPKVIKGGEEIITKYHIPFIAMEFCIHMIQIHQTNVLEFLKFFENNGYKLSQVDFLSKNYLSSEEFMKIKEDKIINIFAVYENFLE